MGLIGKKVGQTAEIKAPKGVIRFEVVRIRFNLEE
jgi:transcription elongation GreA/GreB family factor